MSIIGIRAILRIIAVWNNFVGPLLYLRDSKLQVIAVALLHLEGEYTKNWGKLMGGYTIASIPLIIMFLFCMRLFFQLALDKRPYSHLAAYACPSNFKIGLKALFFEAKSPEYKRE